jgi:large repetitive protein
VVSLSVRHARYLTLTIVVALIASFLFFVASPANADTAPPDATTPLTVSSDALPTVQINGVVWSQVIIGNTVYAGGNFSSAQPAGNAAGVGTVARTNVLAYNLTTGALITTFNPVLNGEVKSVAASPDGTRLYIGGSFTTVGGVTRNRIAALDPTTGALITAFNANSNGLVNAVTATNSVVYLGGNFATIGGAARGKLAAVSAATGAVLAGFTPVAAGGNPWSMVLSPDGGKLVVGGAFTTVNGSSDPGYGLAWFDTATGAMLALPVNHLIRNGAPDAAITSVSSDGTSFYATGYVYGSTGNLEGTVRADWATGNIQWIEDCHGDTYSGAPQGDAFYVAGHPHYCGNIGGFPQTSPTWTFHRGIAFSKAITQTITADPYGYYNYEGNPAPSLLHWYPDFNTGTFTGQTQGPWSVASNSNYVVYGGEFTTVNLKRQQGLVRFAVKTIAPNTDAPRLSGAGFVPSLVSLVAGSVRVSWLANYDRDNELLTYNIYRDNNQTTPVYTTTAKSSSWNQPSLGFVDTGLTPGQTYAYRIKVTDPMGNTIAGDKVNVTVSTDASLSPYASTVLQDGAQNFWRLGESAGATKVYNWAGFSDAIPSGGVTFGTTGAIGSDANKSATFDGNTGLIATQSLVPGPQTFSIETWFKTTSTAGGKIVGFGNSNTGTSSNYDRHVYMDTSGRVLFGVYPGEGRIVQSSPGYNDGNWHQVVATLSSAGQTLFVDGIKVGSRSDTTSAQAYSGYWRIGGDTSWSGANYFAGSIDDTAIYPTALTQVQVNQHFVASGRTSVLPSAPADSYGNRIFNDAPDFYWRLGESSGSTAADASISLNPGTYQGGVTKGQSGALGGVANTAALFDGSSGIVVSNRQVSNPTTYSEEIWFNTTTNSGGKLIGFGNASSGLSGNYDRHIYMDDAGHLVFGVWTGFTNTITTSATYNDGNWHQVVSTQGADGMKLYVDGSLAGTNPQASSQAYDGYWRIGGDNTWGSSSAYFSGKLDEAAVYSQVLSAATVQQHFALGGGTVVNAPPTASFAPTVTNLGLAVDASASADSDGTIVSYAWNFGDSTTGSGKTTTHTFAAAGNYTVTLTVTDNLGASTSSSTTVSATLPPNVLPTASFTTSATNLVASFNAAASGDTDGTIVSYAWNFGDLTTGSGVTTNHTYLSGGTFSVVLTVTDNRGGTATSTVPVTVAAAPPPNVPPTASFSSTTTNLAVAFNAGASADSDGTIAFYAWNFGDGTTGGGMTPTHTYTTAGTFNVSLTVTDDKGATGVSTGTVSTTLPPNVPPVASFTSSSSGLTASFNGSGSSDPDGTITSYSWNFGDTATGSGASISHTYAVGGTYTVTLTVTDNRGGSTTTTSTVTVTAPSATPFALDAFARSVTNGWGNADTGGAWTRYGAANFLSVAGGSGKIVLNSPSAQSGAYLGSVAQTSTDMRVQFSVNNAATGGGVYLYATGRRVSSNTEYRASIRLRSNGTIGVSAVAYKGSATGVTLGTEVILPGTVTAGTAINVRLQVTGTSPTTIRIKTWVAGTAEPTAWTVTSTDNFAGLQTAGGIGVMAYLSSSSTNAPVTLSVQQLSAFPAV